MPDSALPDSLKNSTHLDYKLWPLNRIPRGWTAFKWGKPKLIAGNQTRTRKDAPAPIGEPGSWQVSYHPGAPWWSLKGLYFAVTLNNGRHFRIGARWDDVDNYCTFPSIASRVYKSDGEEDTSTN